MELFGWPLITTGLMFFSFWVGKIQGFADGNEVGFEEGINAASPAIATAILRWVRQEKDIHISDPEIKEIIDNINVEWKDKDDE